MDPDTARILQAFYAASNADVKMQIGVATLVGFRP
jgi:hypothetical protein